MSIFKYISLPPIHNAFRWGNIHLWHGWQKAFCFYALGEGNINSSFLASICLDTLSPTSPVTPKSRVPQLKENDSIATDRWGFPGKAQHVVQFQAEFPSVSDKHCWKSGSSSLRWGSQQWGSTIPHAVPLLSYLDCISASLLQCYHVLILRHM